MPLTIKEIEETVKRKEGEEKYDQLWREYESCARYEQELCRVRLNFFTALLSISLLVGGFCLQYLQDVSLAVRITAIVLAWLIFVAAYYHYWWFHRKSHDLRDHLKRLEEALKIFPYRIRTHRPKLFNRFPVYYHWVIDALAVVFTLMLVFAILRLAGVL